MIFLFTVIFFQVETGGNQGVLFKTHPNINKELFNNENILGLKDPNRPFPTGQAGDGVSLLKWRMQSVDESVVPLTSVFASYLTDFSLIPSMLCVFSLSDKWFKQLLSQLTAGPLYPGMKHMSASSMKPHQRLIYKMLWSPYLFRLLEKHQM